MKTTEFLKENSIIAQEADDMHKDHEVQMARSQMYSAAQSAIEIHRLLKDISELEGLDGWVASKLTLASEYLETVRDYLKYEAVSAESEMMEFAYESADYAMNNLLVEKANLNEIGDTPAGKAALNSYVNKADAQVAAHWREVHNKSHLPTNKKMANRNSSTLKAYNRTRPDLQPAYYGKNNKANDTDTVNEMASAGASSSSGMATSMSGPAHKPTSGVPKKLGNAHKPKKVTLGKGVY